MAETTQSVAHEELEVEDGDRYVTCAPCCSTCLSVAPSSSASRAARGDGGADGGCGDGASYLAVSPYSYVFTAAVKGRWLQRSLLELFVKEFAYVAPPPARASTPAAHAEVQSACDVTSVDARLTIAAYVEELCEGQLWLHGRESECRSAGRLYQHALYAWYTQRDGSTSPPATADKGNESVALGATDWHDVKAWLRGQAHHAATEADVGRAAPAPLEVHTWLQKFAPPLLVLRQQDTVKHRVWRREGRLFADAPLHILRCDLTAPLTSSSLSSASKGRCPRVLVVSKPCGLPVHPSGAYRKNSVTAILEDVFGGEDRHRYCAVESHAHTHAQSQSPSSDACAVAARPERRYVSVRHATRGFELVRIWRHHRDADGAESGVADADVAALLSLVGGPAVVTDPSGAAGTRKRSRSPPVAQTAPSPLKAFVVHRLDAATGGVLLFGLDSDGARQLAATIANKEDATTGSDEATQAASSAKTYVARVHGHVKLEELARTQRGCQLVDRPVEEEEEEEGGAGCTENTTSSWLLLRRPIGCLSFHLSTYWSPGPARERRWHAQQDAEARQLAETAAPMHAPILKRGQQSQEALLAKRARMRARAHGTRGAQATSDSADATTTTTTTGDAIGVVFEPTLRSAATLVRVAWYDAASDTSLVVCQLLTGRTHQLRVHLATLGHPIVGDDKYVDLTGVIGVREWRLPCAVSPDPTQPHDNVAKAAETEAEEEDGVDLFARLPHGPVSAEGASVSESTEGRHCICPQRICLHARRYVLQLGGRDAGSLTAIAPLPAWATPPLN